MFEPGHLHRSNPPGLGGQPGYSIDFYYEVRKDPREGPMLHGRLLGEIDGKAFEEVFDMHRDTAFNFASVISRLVAKHGLHPNHSPIMRAHEEYDAIFGDIRAKLHASRARRWTSIIYSATAYRRLQGFLRAKKTGFQDPVFYSRAVFQAATKPAG